MTTRPDPLVNQVLAHANRVHNLLAEQGRGEAASRLAAEAQQWGSAQTTVVVAGDVKRGKSSLVNSLVDRPGLLPVDADVATAVHLVLTYGEVERVTVTDLDGESFDIEPERLADFASMKGDDATVAGVSAVEVVVDDPLLAKGLNIVDTPGVGGMSRGHRDITMAALQQADVLLFVVSLQEPAALSELEFLAEASERIGNVVLVGSRSDLSTDDANDLMAADLSRRIATLAGQVESSIGDGSDPAADSDVDRGELVAKARRLRRLSERPVVVTSSYLADQARRRAERGREEAAADLRRRSGLDDVIASLDRAVGARDQVRLANLLQLTSVLLAGAEDELAMRQRAIDGDSSAEEELRERQEQLERAASNQARWRSTLASSISRLQTSTTRDINRELGLVRDHYREVLDRTQDPLELEQVGDQVQQSLQAAWSNLAGQVATKFNEVIGSLLDDLEIESDADLFGELEVPPAIGAGTAGVRGDAEQIDLLADVLPLATQSFMFGNIANVAAGLLGVATGGLGFMAYGIGAAMAAPIVAVRRKQRRRQVAAQQIHRELTEALFGQEGIARELSTEMTLRIIDAREQLEQLIDDRLVARRKELETRRRELQEILRTEQASRAEARRTAEEVGGRVRGLRDETDRLTGLVDATLARMFEAEARSGAEAEPEASPAT